MLCDNKWWCRQIGRKKKKCTVKSEYLAEKVSNIFGFLLKEKTLLNLGFTFFFFF